MSRKNALTPFEQALVDAALDEFTDIPENEADIDLALSPEFQIRAKKLCINSERKFWHYTNTVVKRAILVAVISALLTVTAAATPSIREAIIRFFTSDKSTHYELQFDADQAASAPENIQTAYIPTYIPNHYKLESEEINVIAVDYLWKNDNGDRIIFHQVIMPHDPENTDWLGINATDVETSYLIMGDYKVMVNTHEQYVQYVWTTSECLFILTADDINLSGSEMDKIFYSIAINPDIIIPEYE